MSWRPDRSIVYTKALAAVLLALAVTLVTGCGDGTTAPGGTGDHRAENERDRELARIHDERDKLTMEKLTLEAKIKRLESIPATPPAPAGETDKKGEKSATQLLREAAENNQKEQARLNEIDGMKDAIELIDRQIERLDRREGQLK